VKEICGGALKILKMLYINYENERDLIHSSIRNNIKVRVLKSVHVDRVLVLAPHPDDDVFGCGALLAHMVRNRAKLRVLYFCAGALGNIQGKKEYDLVGLREQEAVAAVREIGGNEVNFFRYDDLELEKVDKLWEKIYEEVISHKPDLVLIPDGNDWHPDHEALYAASVIALRKVRKNKPKVWEYFVWGIDRPTHLFPIDKKTENIKRAAMSCHRSQLKVKAYDEAILSMNDYIGKGLGLDRPAEGYREMNL